MPFPEPERFGIKDLAGRWGISEENVCEQIRAGHFKQLIDYTPRGGGFTHRYTISPYAPPENAFSIKPPLGNFGSSTSTERTDRVWVGSIRSMVDFPWPSEGSTLYIPRTEVEAFEKKHGIYPVQVATPPTTGDFSWIHSKPLQAAVEVYYELYSLKKHQPKQAHKPQILDWLKKRYPNLNSHTRESIAILVNPNKKGGAPPQN